MNSFKVWAGGVAQHLRALAAPAEDLSLVPGDPTSSSGLLWFIHTWCTYIHAGKTLIYVK